MLSPFSKVLCARAKALGDRGFRDSLAWPNAEDDTQVYLEVLGAPVAGLSLRGTFLPGVLLLIVGVDGAKLTPPAFATGVGVELANLPED